MATTALVGTAPVGTAPVGTAPVGTAPVGTAPFGTAPVGTAPATTAGADGLDRLAELAATCGDDAAGRTWLASVVQGLEQRAGASLGGTGTDPVVVLQRRLDRARRLLAAEDATGDRSTVPVPVRVG